MFGSHFKKRSTPLPFVILRSLLSVVMLTILGVAVYQAYRSFSGIDPLKLDPKTFVYSFISSDKSVSFLNQAFGTNLSKQLTSLGVGGNNKTIPSSPGSQLGSLSQNRQDIILKFAIVTDSHNDNDDLKKALDQARGAGAKFVIGLGDYTQVGTLNELQAAKKVFDSSGLPYYCTVGDHDLWDCRNKNQAPTCNYSQVFGLTYQSFTYNNVRLIILYNSDNYNGVDDSQIQWLSAEVDKLRSEKPVAVFGLVDEPLYHPSSDHFMGKSNEALRKQAQQLANLFKNAGTKAVFAGDTHVYSSYSDPQTDLPMYTVGAVTAERNTQSPRFAIVDVYSDGSYNVEDTVIK